MLRDKVPLCVILWALAGAGWCLTPWPELPAQGRQQLAEGRCSQVKKGKF